MGGFPSQYMVTNMNDNNNNKHQQPSYISFQDNNEIKCLTITHIEVVNHNTKIYTIALENPLYTTGLITSSFVKVQGNDEETWKPYTPISPASQRGGFQLLIKIYPDGKVSKYLDSKKEGETINVKGPFLKLPYKPGTKKYIGMIAGGSGITPMYQVINEIIATKDDVNVVLLYSNSTEEDILLKNQLEQIVSENPKIQVVLTVSRPGSDWKGVKGRITETLLSEVMPPPSPAEMMIYVCGPPSFMDTISGNKTPDAQQGSLVGYLKNLGYTEEMVFKF